VTRYSYMITAALCVLLLVPQPSRADGEKIVDVVVRGNRRIEASAILNVITAKPGDLLNSDRTDMDIRAIYRLGQFQDVQVSLEPVSGGVVLVYSVVENRLSGMYASLAMTRSNRKNFWKGCRSAEMLFFPRRIWTALLPI